MNTRAEVIEIIHQALRTLNAELPPSEQVPVANDTRLFGPDASLDSLSLVSVIVDVETGVSDRFAQQVSLTDDEAMSQEVSPFADVGTLADYVVKLLARN
jgi:acyl carrier protein